MRSKIPRTVVQGPVVGPWEVTDFVFAVLPPLAFIFVNKPLWTFITFPIALFLIGKLDKLRFRFGPGYVQRELYKADLLRLKGLPPYKVLWHKMVRGYLC
jgi:hypothetical protein